MNRSTTLALLALAAFTAIADGARAGTEARVLDTYPAGKSVTLGANQNYYLRIGYSTDLPVNIWARPYFQGREVRAGTNPSPTYTGSGDALGWFFFMEPGDRVDEIRITAGDRSGTASQLVATHQVRIVGGDTTRPAAQEPVWVTELLRETERRQREAYEKQMSTPTTAGDSLLFTGFMLLVAALGIAGFAAPAVALRRWRGAWRIAAAVPAVMVTFVVLRIVLDTGRDSTSHNLWPFEILQVCALSLVVIGILFASRKLVGVRA